ncbi:hypothetical protein ABXV23_25775 [Vibrio owensii]|uniref:hypothetical protein n=1 Tax=Vibrio owensii TaxID=696485 RepID=UPI00339AE379
MCMLCGNDYNADQINEKIGIANTANRRANILEEDLRDERLKVTRLEQEIAKLRQEQEQEKEEEEDKPIITIPSVFASLYSMVGSLAFTDNTKDLSKDDLNTVGECGKNDNVGYANAQLYDNELKLEISTREANPHDLALLAEMSMMDKMGDVHFGFLDTHSQWINCWFNEGDEFNQDRCTKSMAISFDIHDDGYCKFKFEIRFDEGDCFRLCRLSAFIMRLLQISNIKQMQANQQARLFK